MSTDSLLKKNNKLYQSKLWWIAPPTIVCLIMLVIYYINDIFPFGEESIVYYDMVQVNVPIYYNAWDILHGAINPLFHWETAAGIFINSSCTAILTPINVIFLLICPRNMILESMSFLILIKISLSALTATAFFSYKFKKLNPYWRIIFSVLYAFNSYVLQYYTNCSWLDIVLVFPLIMLALAYMFDTRRTLPYIALLSYCVFTQLYISFMIFLYLFIVGGLYIFIVLDKEKRRTAVFDFGLSSVASIIVSAFAALPSYLSTTGSSRYQSTKDYWEIVTSTATNSANKLGMIIILTALPLMVCGLMLLKYKAEKKKINFFILAMLVCTLPVFFENVNLFWHMGTYIQFSMRFAFVLHFTLLSGACFAIERFGDSVYFLKNKFVFIPVLVASVIVVYYAAKKMFGELYDFPSSKYNLIFDDNAVSMVIVFLCFCLAYLMLMALGGKRTACVMIAGLVLFETGFFANRAFSVGHTRNYEYSYDYISDSEKIYDGLTIENDKISRIKNIDASLNSNYPLVAGYPSMSNFTHVIPSTIKKTMKKLGYSNAYTRILDSGGTLFSDALLGYKYSLSATPLQSSAYSSLGKAGDYYLYKNNYTFPFALVTSPNIINPDIFASTPFSTSNNILSSITKSYETLFDFPITKNINSDDTMVFTFDIEGERELYLAFSSMPTRRCIRVYVNGEALNVPFLDVHENSLYTTVFNNGVLDAGKFKDESVTVVVEILNDKVSPQNLYVDIAALNLGYLSEICSSLENTTTSEAGSMSLSVTAHSDNDSDYLFIPMTFDEGWSCTVNGKDVEPEVALDTFMAVKLEKGENTVEFKYMPRGLILGIAITLVAVAALIILMLINKKRGDGNWLMLKGWMSKTLNIGYLVALCGTLVALYIIPIGYKLFSLISEKL